MNNEIANIVNSVAKRFSLIMNDIKIVKELAEKIETKPNGINQQVNKVRIKIDSMGIKAGQNNQRIEEIHLILADLRNSQAVNMSIIRAMWKEVFKDDPTNDRILSDLKGKMVPD